VKIEILRRDDTANPEVGKKAGAGADHSRARAIADRRRPVTGRGGAIAPLTAEAKVPFLISIAAGGSAIPRISPYVARGVVHALATGLPDRQMGRRTRLENRLHRRQRFHPGA
jgi:hypothetical protein